MTVYFNQRRRKWLAEFWRDNRREHSECFDTKAEADLKAKQAAQVGQPPPRAPLPLVRESAAMALPARG